MAAVMSLQLRASGGCCATHCGSGPAVPDP